MNLFDYVKKAIAALTSYASKVAALEAHIVELEAKLAESSPEVVAELKAQFEAVVAENAQLKADEDAEDATEAELAAQLAALLTVE